jgi:hypothetical protein
MNQPVCKTNYVYVEMILKKSSQTYDVVAGLFKGIYEDKKKGGVFILLAGLKGVTDCLNLEFYSIMTIEELEEDYRNMDYVIDTEEDQAKALAALKALKEKLIIGGKGSESDKDIIDETKYTKVPEDYKKGQPIGAKFDQAGTGNFAAATTRYEKSNYNTYNKTVIKKDPEPTSFERKREELPAAEFLAALSTRIDAITSGELDLELPAIMGADEAGVGFDDDDPYNGIGCMCG